jgi:hypothetical protein
MGLECCADAGANVERRERGREVGVGGSPAAGRCEICVGEGVRELYRIPSSNGFQHVAVRMKSLFYGFDRIKMRAGK